MSWQAEIIRKERSNRLDIIVRYSNGTDSSVETISTVTTQPSSWLSDQITQRLDQLNNLDIFAQTIPSGPFTPAITPKPVITSQEQARLDFQDNYNSYKKMQTAIANGLLKETDQTYLDEVAYIKANYIDSYKDLIY